MSQPQADGNTTFGFIGLGDMGLPMARRLLAAGARLVAWNRSPDKLDALVAEGAERAKTAAEVGRRADLIGLCLTSHDAVEQVAFGPDGLLTGLPGDAPRWVADFPTAAPQAAIAWARRARQAGAGWVDAPVSGGVPAATNGALVVFAGGEDEDLRALGPLLAPLASRVTHMGPAGAGQAAKICNQMIVSANLLVIAEALATARRAGVDVARLPEAFRGGFADSAPLQVFGPRMAGHLFTPRLGAIALMQKDVRLARALVAQAGAHAPILELCASLYDSVQGRPDVSTQDDLSRIIALFESLTPPPPRP